MKKSLLFFLMLFTSAVLHAQVTTSSLSGTVQEPTGESAIGTSIKATHVPSGTTYSTVVNETGRFNIPNMRVGGPYTVEMSHVSFQTSTFENIILLLGQPYIVNATLNEGGTQLGEVVIMGQGGSKLNTNRTGASTNISTDALETLPTISRSLTDFTRLTPQSSGTSFAGRDGRYNNLQIDGSNFNNGFGLSDAPLPGGNSQPISLDAIEEVQVNIAPFDIRQSGFTGAGINAVTRSGTNTFTGSVYGYYNNENFQGNKINNTELDESEEATTKNYGFRLGGPIIKNKLFFFVNAERVEETGANASGVNLWRASENGVADPDRNIARTSIADLTAVKDHLINQWGYDPGRYEGYANDAKQHSTKLLARIDWNINDVHKLAVRYNQVVGVSNSLTNASSGPSPRSSTGRVSSNSISFENSNYGMENTVRSITAELSSNFTPSLSNQFLATYSKIQDKRTSKSDVFPMVDIWDGSATGTNYMTFGYELFTYNNDVVNDNYSFVNNLTYVTGDHTITGGAAFEMQKFGNAYVRMGTSYYRYKSVEDFLSTGGPNEAAPIMFGLTYPYEGMDPYSRVNFGQASLYVQDRYTVDDRLDVTVGLRAELPIYLNDLTANPGINSLELLDRDGNPKNYDSGNWPKSRIMLSPRIGFNYDVEGDRSLILRGGTGIFTGRVPFVWLTNMPTNAGVIQNNVEPRSYDAVADWIGGIRFNPDPYHWLNNPVPGSEDVFIKTPSGGNPSSFALVDDEFKMPKIWRTSFGVDYQIPNTPLTAIADLLYTRDINAVYQFSANRARNVGKMNYAPGDDRDFYTSENVAYNEDLGASNATILTNTDEKGHSYSATIGLTLPQRIGGFAGGIYYTHSGSKEVSSNPGSNASSAWENSPSINNPNDQFLYHSAYALPHRVNANISYSVEYLNHLATTFSVFYNGSHQGRFSYQYNSDFNGDGTASDLIFLPQNTSDITFVDITNDDGVLFTAAEQAEAFDIYVAENDLEKYRGEYLERNNFLMPWLNRFDIRIAQEIMAPLGNRKHSLEISLDILNFGNLLNKEWGVQQTLNNAQRLLIPASVSATNPTFNMMTVSEENQVVLPTSPFRDVVSYNSTWKMQLGLRYSF
ncbi:TonB-dependent receptor [Albibacterium profundi]|uniref:Carboxypeptidase regulatory-like domain-containing protein n=1 Tax=Albibacterium profundi TaxID=3134906 RepID=A0ABV5CIQ9_9SPHI